MEEQTQAVLGTSNGEKNTESIESFNFSTLYSDSFEDVVIKGGELEQNGDEKTDTHTFISADDTLINVRIKMADINIAQVNVHHVKRTSSVISRT